MRGICGPKGRFRKEGNRDNLYHHLVLLAKDQEGYLNLLKLSAPVSWRAFIINREWIRNFMCNKGLIALSACMAGEIPEPLLWAKKKLWRYALV